MRRTARLLDERGHDRRGVHRGRQAIEKQSPTQHVQLEFPPHDVHRQPGKPYLFEDALENDFGVLLDLLEQAVEAARDPEAMLAWERQTVLRLRTRYPADRDTLELTLGEPVTRNAFQNATQSR